MGTVGGGGLSPNDRSMNLCMLAANSSTVVPLAPGKPPMPGGIRKGCGGWPNIEAMDTIDRPEVGGTNVGGLFAEAAIEVGESAGGPEVGVPDRGGGVVEDDLGVKDVEVVGVDEELSLLRTAAAAA